MPINWGNINFGGSPNESPFINTIRRNTNLGNFPVGSQYGTTQEDEDENSMQQYLKRIQEIYAAKGPSRTQYESMLNAPPRMEDYRPGKMNRFTSILAGATAGFRDPMAGIEAARDVQEHPYNRALSDYQTKVEAARRGSELERLAAEDEAMAMSRAATSGLNYNKFVRGAAQKDVDLGIKASDVARKSNWTNIWGASRQEQDRLAREKEGRLGQEGSARIDVSRGQLGVSQGQLGLGRDRLKADTEYRNRMATVAEKNAITNEMRAKATAAGGRIRAGEIETATANALADLYLEPEFRDTYITKDDSGNYVVTENDGSEQWQKFKTAWKLRVGELLGGKY